MGYKSLLLPKIPAAARFKRAADRGNSKETNVVMITQVEEVRDETVEPFLPVEPLLYRKPLPVQTKDASCLTDVQTKDASCVTDVTTDNYYEYIEHLHNKIASLKQQVRANQFSLKYFKDDDKKTRFYTGTA